MIILGPMSILTSDLTETKYHLRRWKNYTRELDMIVVAVAIIEQNHNPGQSRIMMGS